MNKLYWLVSYAYYPDNKSALEFHLEIWNRHPAVEAAERGLVILYSCTPVPVELLTKEQLEQFET